MLTMIVAAVGSGVAFELVAAARRADHARRARALVPRPRRTLPVRVRGPLVRALADAEVAILPEDAVRLWVAGTAGATLVGSSLAPALGILAGVAAALAAPVALRLAAGRRTAALVAALPELVDEVAADLRGGGTVRRALDRVADGSGRLAPDIAAATARVDLGLDLGDALTRWTDERPHPGFAEVAGALAVAAATGGRAATALTGLGASLRERLACLADARALSAQARASAVVVGMAPIVYLTFSAVVDPGSVEVLVATGPGRACLVVGVTLDAIAALWMRRLLRFAP